MNLLMTLKFTYISQMEHAIAKFLAQSAADPDVADKLDAVWTVCLGKDHVDLWDKKLAQAFSQLELPIEWTLVGDVLQTGMFTLYTGDYICQFPFKLFCINYFTSV